MYYIWIILQFIVAYSLVFPLVLLLFSLLRKVVHIGIPADEEADYAIIVTAYEESSQLPFVVDSILKLNYSNFLVYLVADQCDISQLSFTDKRIILLRPEEKIASNTGSHFYAIQHFKREHKRLTIIDSDNLVAPGFLTELNAFFDAGFKAVQGIRKPKNLDTSMAAIDAFRDLYYHYYDGKALFRAGSSATLSGSGMAFEVALFSECLKNKNVQGAGFDKVLQYEIVRRDERIAFAESAIVYDEKTRVSGQLVQQRSRWIFTWLKYFKFGFKLISLGLKDGSFNQALFGIILLRPPLFITLLLSFTFLIINMLTGWALASIWILCLAAFLISFLIPLMQRGVDNRIIKGLAHVPEFIFYQVVSLLNMRSGVKNSVATRHLHHSNVDDLRS